MIKILFVCHGNICRSPMAEFIFKQMLKEKNMSDKFFVASAATSYEEIGNKVHYGTKRILASRGIDCSEKRAVHIEKSDYEKYDLLIGMDSYNIKNMIRLFGGDPKGKIKLLLDYTGESRDVADPWYTGDFKITEDDIVRGCEAVLNSLSC